MHKTITINHNIQPGSFSLKEKYDECDLLLMLVNHVLRINNPPDINVVQGNHRISWEGCYYDDLAIDLQFTRTEKPTEIIIDLEKITLVEDLKPF